MPSWSLPDAVPARPWSPAKSGSPKKFDDSTQEMPALVWAPLRPAPAERPEDRTLDSCTRLPGLEDPDASVETAESAPETADSAELEAVDAVDAVEPEDADPVAPEDSQAVEPQEAAEEVLPSGLPEGLGEPVAEPVDAVDGEPEDRQPADRLEDTAPSASSPAPAAPEGETAQAAPAESVFGVEGLDPDLIEAQSARGDTIPVLVVVPPEVLAYQAETEQQGGDAPSWCTGGWHAAPSPVLSPESAECPQEWAFQVGAATADEPDGAEAGELAVSDFESPDSAVQAEDEEQPSLPAELPDGTSYGLVVPEPAGGAEWEHQVPDLANLSPTEYGYVLALPPEGETEPEAGMVSDETSVEAVPEAAGAETEVESGEPQPEAVVVPAEAEAGSALLDGREPGLEPVVEADGSESGPSESVEEADTGLPEAEGAAFEPEPEPEDAEPGQDPEPEGLAEILYEGSEETEPEVGAAALDAAEPVLEPVDEPEAEPEAAGAGPEAGPGTAADAGTVLPGAAQVLAGPQAVAQNVAELSQQPEEALRTAELLPDSAPETAPEPEVVPKSDPAPAPEPADAVPEAARQVPEAVAAALPSPRTVSHSRSERPRSVLVTGASRGIGRAVAQALLDAGDHVVGLSRSGEAPEGALGLATDVTDEAALDEAIARAEAEHGPVEVLVACAGIARDSLAARTSDATWEAMLDTDLTGVFRTVRAVLPQMMRARSGRIVLVSSVVASRGGVGQVAYGAAKAGVEGLVRSLARELAPRGITVNAVAPGFVATDMTNSLPTVVRESHVAATPIGRMATAQEVAAPVVFLASPAASYITGTVLPVDGGLGMGR